jgi:hypothetical protein
MLELYVGEMGRIVSKCTGSEQLISHGLKGDQVIRQIPSALTQ